MSLRLLRLWFRPGLFPLTVAVGAFTAIAQDPIATFPKNYSLALDNDVVSVIHVHYGPRERLGVHDHSKFPTIYVYLSDSGPVRFEHDEKPPFALNRPPTVKGAFRVSPGRIERHSVENLGDISSDFLRVELKQMPLGGSVQPFRGKAPRGMLQSSRTVEFRSPELDIERVICERGAPCKIEASVGPSLLIAFSPVNLTESERAPRDQSMRDGDIKWLQGSQPISVAASSSVPAHLLRITFKAPAE